MKWLMMIEVLQNKNSATRFQIMAEIASAGPNIHQKNIALKLGISPQAVSEYVRQLSEEKLLTAESRSSYKKKRSNDRQMHTRSHIESDTYCRDDQRGR